MIEANYHTHTVRCNHAEGTEREYIGPIDPEREYGYFTTVLIKKN